MATHGSYLGEWAARFARAPDGLWEFVEFGVFGLSAVLWFVAKANPGWEPVVETASGWVTLGVFVVLVLGRAYSAGYTLVADRDGEILKLRDDNDRLRRLVAAHNRPDRSIWETQRDQFEELAGPIWSLASDVWDRAIDGEILRMTTSLTVKLADWPDGVPATITTHDNPKVSELTAHAHRIASMLYPSHGYGFLTKEEHRVLDSDRRSMARLVQGWALDLRRDTHRQAMAQILRGMRDRHEATLKLLWYLGIANNERTAVGFNPSSFIMVRDAMLDRPRDGGPQA